MKSKFKLIMIIILITLTILGSYGSYVYKMKYDEAIKNHIVYVNIFLNRALNTISSLEDDRELTDAEAVILKDYVFLSYHSIDNLKDLLGVKEDIQFGEKLINGEIEENINNNQMESVKEYIQVKIDSLNNLYSGQADIKLSDLRELLIRDE